MKKSSKRLICLLIVFTTVLSLAITPAIAESYIGRVYIFTYTALNLSNAGFPIGINSPILRNLWDIDYNAGEYLNNNAQSVASVLQSSKVCIIACRGEVGTVVCTDSNLYSSTICADELNPNYTNSTNDVALSNMTGISPKYNRLTMYLGSRTGDTPDPVESSYSATGYLYPANLVNQTYFRSSKCVVGWREDYLKPESYKKWLEKFTDCCTDFYTVEESISNATSYIESIYGITHANPLKNVMIRGDASFYLAMSDN